MQQAADDRALSEVEAKRSAHLSVGVTGDDRFYLSQRSMSLTTGPSLAHTDYVIGACAANKHPVPGIPKGHVETEECLIQCRDSSINNAAVSYVRYASPVHPSPFQTVAG